MQVGSERIRKVNFGECSVIIMQEDMLSIGVKLVGTIGVIEATVQLLFALVFERLLNAFLYRLA